MQKLQIDGSAYIEVYEPHHASELFQLIRSSKESLGEWLDFPNHTNEFADTLSFIERVQNRNRGRDGFWAGIWDGQTLVGSIGLLYIDWDNRKTEIGYWLGQQHVGHGYVTRACSSLMGYIFFGLELNRIEIRMKEGNIRSKLIPERLGFKLDGVLRESEFWRGTAHNILIYSMLKNEWSDRTLKTPEA